MATLSSILAWRIPWTVEPAGLQSIGLQRVTYDSNNLAYMQKDIYHNLLNTYIYIQIYKHRYLSIYRYAYIYINGKYLIMVQSVQSLTCVQIFVTPWTAACQASLSITNSWNLLKLMSIELVMPSNHLILYSPFSSCLQSFPASGSFPVNQRLTSGGQSIRVSASTSVLSMNIQDGFPLGWIKVANLYIDDIKSTWWRKDLKL